MKEVDHCCSLIEDSIEKQTNKQQQICLPIWTNPGIMKIYLFKKNAC